MQTANTPPQATQPITVTVQIRKIAQGQPLFGGGFCSTGSGGGINWDDHSPETPFPAVTASAKDACARQGTQRLGSTDFTFYHTYFETGPHRMLAWVQGDFKDNENMPNLPRRGVVTVQGDGASWRCGAQMWLDVNF